MITIESTCDSCSWTWKPRKAEGPKRDYERAKAAGLRHSVANPGHIVTSSSREQLTTHRGSSVRSLYLEIVCR